MTDAEIRRILQETKVIAVVGISPKPDRPSHEVAQFLQDHGYRIIPVNPGIAGQTLLGETVYPDLAAIPADAKVDLVDVFRASDAVPGVVDDALAHLPDAQTIWMQLGVTHEPAAEKARAAGKQVIMDHCIKIEYRRLMP